jgi:hypothetical protein
MKFLINTAETEFREQKTYPLLTKATKERGLLSTRRSGSGEREGKGERRGSRDRGHHKELNKKDMTWLLWDS